MSEQELVQAYSQGRLNRREFIRKLRFLGISAGAALVYAEALAPRVAASALTRDEAGFFVVRGNASFGIYGVYGDGDEEDEDEDDDVREDDHDRRTEGDVVGVRCDLSAPIPPKAQGEVPFNPADVPYLLIGNIDGIQQIRLIKELKAVCPSIRVGDYITAWGEKQHEHLFDADRLRVDRRAR
jgi:hypothetical protein